MSDASSPLPHDLSRRALSGGALRALSARSDGRGAAQLGFHLLLLIAAGLLVGYSNAWTIVPAMLLLGVAQVALFAPLHETMHLTAFASRRINAVVGWLVATPSLLNWHFYTAFHLAHHRHTQDPDRDPELSPPPPGAFGSYLFRVSGLLYWRARAKVIADCWRGDLSAYPYVPPASRRRIIRSVQAMSLAVAGSVMAGGLLFGWWTPLAFWVGPQLMGQPLLRLYLLTEHTFCSHDGNGFTNTRTTLTNLAVRRLMWNMSYHAEHHLYPSIPFHRLPDAHDALRGRLSVLQHGYAKWHAGYVSGLLRGR